MASPLAKATVGFLKQNPGGGDVVQVVVVVFVVYGSFCFHGIGALLLSAVEPGTMSVATNSA